MQAGNTGIAVEDEAQKNLAQKAVRSRYKQFILAKYFGNVGQWDLSPLVTFAGIGILSASFPPNGFGPDSRKKNSSQAFYSPPLWKGNVVAIIIFLAAARARDEHFQLSHNPA